MSIIRPMRFQQPRSVTQTYGAPASLTIAPAAPSIPFESGAGLMHGGTRGAAMAAPYMPTPAAPVMTNPNLTPFQQSVNNERAQTAMKAATFAKGAPLPYKPIPAPSPAAQVDPTYLSGGSAYPIPGMNPDVWSQYPTVTNLAGQAQPQQTPSTTPQQIAPTAPGFVSKAPAGQEYNGAYGHGIAGEQLAQAARDAYVQQHNDVANAQDRGPGLGVNSYANAELQQDANERANTEVDTPNAKDQYYEGRAALAQAQAGAVPGKMAVDQARAGQIAGKTQNDQELLPGKLAQQTAKTEAIGKGADSGALNAKTGAAKEGRLAGTPTAAAARAGADSAKDQTKIHEKLYNQASKDLESARNQLAAIPPVGNAFMARRSELQATIKALEAKQHDAALKWSTAIDAANMTRQGAAKAKSAAEGQPEIYHNPQTGEQIRWDPTANAWVKHN